MNTETHFAADADTGEVVGEVQVVRYPQLIDEWGGLVGVQRRAIDETDDQLKIRILAKFKSMGENNDHNI